MAYGDTMVYAWSMEVENEDGDGNIKKEVVTDKIYLSYTAKTPFVYKTMFGREFLHDITKMMNTDGDLPAEMQKAIDSGELSVSDLDDAVKLDKYIKSSNKKIEFNQEIMLQLVASMVATNDSLNNKPRRSADEILNSIPCFALNTDFITDFVEFIIFGISSAKKKIVTPRLAKLLVRRK